MEGHWHRALPAAHARILKIDPNERKIGLTTRDVEPLTDEEREQLAGGHHDVHHDVAHETHAADTPEAEAPSAEPAAEPEAEPPADDDNPQT